MATYTTNMHLIKPDSGDTANISDINGNRSTLDGHRHGGGLDGLAVKAVQAGGVLPGSASAGELFVTHDTAPIGLYYYAGGAWHKVENSPAAAGLTWINQVVVSPAQPVIEFTDIPGTFRHLKVAFAVRGTYLATVGNMFLRINDDTLANYDYQYISASGAAASCGQAVNATYLMAGSLTMASGSSPIRAFGGGELTIADYRNTARDKAVLVANWARWDAAATAAIFIGGSWHKPSPQAVTKLTFYLSQGSFEVDSVITLYGMQ